MKTTWRSTATRQGRRVSAAFFPSLRSGKNPGGNSPDCHSPSLRSGEEPGSQHRHPAARGRVTAGIIYQGEAMKFRSPLLMAFVPIFFWTSLPVHAERIAAPKPVKSVIKDGIEYSALPDSNGYVVARWQKTNSVIWSKQIYVVKFDYGENALEEDVQLCLITNLQLDGNKLLVTNERGYEYVLDLNSLDVKVLKGHSIIDLSKPQFPSLEVNIRLKNETGDDMQNVSVNFRGQVINYGFISKGEYSKYYKPGRAYGYAYVEWKARNTIKKVVPVDYVGEKELEVGNYTYIILPLKGEDIYWINLQKDK
jgi:hypothetical protein